MRRTILLAISLLGLAAPGGAAAQVLLVGLESEDAVAVVDPVAGTVIRKIPVGISGRTSKASTRSRSRPTASTTTWP